MLSVIFLMNICSTDNSVRAGSLLCPKFVRSFMCFSFTTSFKQKKKFFKSKAEGSCCNESDGGLVPLELASAKYAKVILDLSKGCFLSNLLND